MAHVTIPIPDGMDETQIAELKAWLTQKAAEATPERLPCEDDPQWQAEAAARIRRGMQDVQAGRVCDSDTARQRLADRCNAAGDE